MTELMRTWILGLTAACLVSSCARALVHRGAAARMTRLVCALVVLLSLLSPLGELDMEEYAFSLAEYRNRRDELTAELEENERRLQRLYIEQECAAYILDEAEKLGLAGRAEVRAAWRDELWVPQEVMLHIKADTQQRAALSQRISAELGIPAERQVWYDGG